MDDNALQGRLLAHSVGIRRKDCAADRLVVGRAYESTAIKGARGRALNLRFNMFRRCEISSAYSSGDSQEANASEAHDQGLCGRLTEPLPTDRDLRGAELLPVT